MRSGFVRDSSVADCCVFGNSVKSIQRKHRDWNGTEHYVRDTREFVILVFVISGLHCIFVHFMPRRVQNCAVWVPPNTEAFCHSNVEWAVVESIQLCSPRPCRFFVVVVMSAVNNLLKLICHGRVLPNPLAAEAPQIDCKLFSNVPQVEGFLNDSMPAIVDVKLISMR